MALIKCYECGFEVSNGARKCPTCGAESPGLGRWGNRLLNFVVGSLALVVIGGVGLFLLL